MSMLRTFRPVTRVLYSRSIQPRYFHYRPPLLVEKQKLDHLLESLSDKYADAKEEYEIAVDSLGTTYAKEDIESAKELTAGVVQEYESILKSVGEEEKKLVRERVGQRIRELVVAVEENLKEEDT